MEQDVILRLERGQHGDALYPSDGEAGRGIYTYLPSQSMRDYYSANGESVFEVDVDAARVVDLTEPVLMSQLIAFVMTTFSQHARSIPGYRQPQVNQRNVQQFGSVIEQFMRQKFPDAMAWIVPHCGHGIPTGKQVVIADERAVLGFREMQLLRPRMRP
jgi:hypothetical protein